MMRSLSHISPMDGECELLLPRVCELLSTSGRSLPDDTSLEKLLDWFTGLIEAGCSLLDVCPSLLDLISSVVNKASSDAGVLSFALKLTGLLAATEEGFTRLQECSLLDSAFSSRHWQEAGLWEDPCLRIGWIHGLKNLMQHHKALVFFVKSDLTKPLLQLQTDPSLFVASAANQMLAHTLVFCQSVLAPGCNGVDDHGDREELTSFYKDIVVAVSKYLKQFLVPGDESHLRKTLQNLKLLALLLAQVQPPLRAELFQTAAGHLEDLATAGYSQLTLPLMDVIMAAYSPEVLDHRVTLLLSSMLSTNSPSDCIQAAASFLRREPRDAIHTAQAVKALLLPLSIITGLTLVKEDDQWPSMADQLKSKSQCVSLVCVCLRNTPQITLMPSDVLPCPPAHIVTAVLSALKLAMGMWTPAGSGELSRNVMHCGRVQKCALEALMDLSSSPGAKEKTGDVFTVLTQYLDNPDTDSTVLHKCYQALVKWTSLCADGCSETQQTQLTQDVAAVVRKRVCDVRWEVRDSTLEFVGQLATGCDASRALLQGCCTTPLLREALQDTESYVRASAISTLAKTLARGWQQGAALSQEEEAIVTRLLEILTQDTEGFPRRAVLGYFIAWFSSGPSHPSSASLLTQCVRRALSHGCTDLDWEVKLHTLELAQLLVDKGLSAHLDHRGGPASRDDPPHPYAVPSHPTCALRRPGDAHVVGVEPGLESVLVELVEQGAVQALLCGLVDCDRPVALKACRLLIRLRETLSPPSQGRSPAVSCDLPDSGWGREISRVLGDCGSELGEGEGRRGGKVGLSQVLVSLGLDERLETLTQSSDHVHNSPLSLLQDILTGSGAGGRPDSQLEEEVIIDCY